MRCDIPLDPRVDQASKNVSVSPDLLEALNHFLSFFLISFVSEQLFIRLHSAVDGVTPCCPKDHSQVKVFVLECLGNPLAPNCPEELGSKNVPRGFQVN